MWTLCLAACLPLPLSVFLVVFFVCLFFFLDFTFAINSNSNLSLSLAVGFVSCGRGGGLRFECSNPSDFRIEADGVVYAARTLQRTTLPASPLQIKASDTATQQQWVTKVRLTSSSQVNTSQPHCNILICLLAILLLLFPMKG